MVLLSSLALAALPASERYLVNDHLAVGVAPDGSLINQDLQLGLWGDPDGPEGEVPPRAEMLLVGWAWALWSLSYDEGGDLVMDAGFDSDSPLELEWEELGVSESLTWVRGSASTDDFDVTITVVLPEGTGGFLWVADVAALAPMTRLRFAHVVDPDPDSYTDYTYETVNTSGPGFAAGEAEIEPEALALALVDGVGGLCEWCTTPDGVLAGAGASSTGDYQLGVTTSPVDLVAGETLRVQVGYALNLDSESATTAAGEMAALVDWDGDGFEGEEDCDELDPETFPGASERADGFDNDCNGAVDDHSTEIDDDGDGYAEVDGDCDDADPSVHPGAVTGDGDADCDGVVEWDPDVPADVKQDAEAPEGCGCQTVSPSPLVLLFLLRRRR